MSRDKISRVLRVAGTPGIPVYRGCPKMAVNPSSSPILDSLRAMRILTRRPRAGLPVHRHNRVPVYRVCLFRNVCSGGTVRDHISRDRCSGTFIPGRDIPGLRRPGMSSPGIPGDVSPGIPAYRDICPGRQNCRKNKLDILLKSVLFFAASGFLKQSESTSARMTSRKREAQIQTFTCLGSEERAKKLIWLLKSGPFWWYKETYRGTGTSMYRYTGS